MASGNGYEMGRRLCDAPAHWEQGAAQKLRCGCVKGRLVCGIDDDGEMQPWTPHTLHRIFASWWSWDILSGYVQIDYLLSWPTAIINNIKS